MRVNIESIEEHDLRHILTCFREMGATEEQIVEEYKNLVNDSKYCHQWLRATGFIGLFGFL